MKVSESVAELKERKLSVRAQCQATLVQFISFLSVQLSTDELVKRLPDVHDLLTTYHIPTEVAFALWRIVYASSISVRLIFDY